MGWCLMEKGASKSKVIAYLRSSYDPKFKSVKSTLAGNQLWSVMQCHDTGLIHIHLDLLGSQGGRWGHKGISEASGPYYYNCPLLFLLVAPVTNQDWRDKVLRYHFRTQALVKGAVVMCSEMSSHGIPMRRATIVERLPGGSFVIFSEAHKRNFKITKKFVDRLEIVG